MPFTHIDLIGLNKHEMFDAPIVGNNDELVALAKVTKQSISIAGMRHSQGGHTALDDGRMVFTEAMKMDIHVDVEKMTVKVNAGATWSDLHFRLGPMGLAPLVHQSSPHFSIGGSLSVDCHGREVHKGALSNTVESITILTNQGGVLKKTTASRIAEPDLFFATLGGYGACGVILDVTLRITENIRLVKYSTPKYRNKIDSLDKLNKYLISASTGLRNLPSTVPAEKINMFYAWMKVSDDPNKYLTHAIAYEYVPQVNANHQMRVARFKNEDWSTTEAMRAAWTAGRNDIKMRGILFDEIATITEQAHEDYLINFLREEISFTTSKGDADTVDLLQEFFIPLPNILTFLTELKDKLQIDNEADIEVLSCTLRVIKPPTIANGKPLLSYAHHQREKSKIPPNSSMVSVALEIKVKKDRSENNTTYPKYTVTPVVITAIQEIIQIALNLEGSYYLPYYQAATPEQFKAAYPNYKKWLEQADKWNPVVSGKRLFDNEFLKTHLK